MVEDRHSLPGDVPEGNGCPGTRWMPVQTSEAIHGRHWRPGRYDLVLLDLNLPEWTECRSRTCAGTTLRRN